MKVKPIVLCDVDGVLANFTKGYAECVAFATGVEVDWRIADKWELAEAFSLSPSQKRDAEHLISAPGFCARLEVLPGTQEGVEKLREVADVRFVTSPWDSSPYWHYERAAWLKKHFDCSSSKQLVHTGDKSHIFGHMLIDDRLRTVQAWREFWMSKGFQCPLGVLWKNLANRHDFYSIATDEWETLTRLVVDNQPLFR